MRRNAGGRDRRRRSFSGGWGAVGGEGGSKDGAFARLVDNVEKLISTESAAWMERMKPPSAGDESESSADARP